MTSTQARIMIWSPPRSLSTAFARSISSRCDTKVFWEPYLNCYIFGPNRKVHWAEDIPGVINEKYTFNYVNELMGEPHPNSQVLFAKCMIEAIIDNFDVVRPDYQHTFLIRHPLKMYRSYEKLSQGVLPIDFKSTFKNIYQELNKCYDHVINVFGQSVPPIIDADDLQENPEGIISKYCEMVGIPYTSNMLKWESIKDPAILNWEFIDVGVISLNSYCIGLTYSGAFTSTGFGNGVKKTETDYSSDVKECADYAMPAYERLHKLRIKV
nr:uncharacterized protein LOC129264069 [Lytechinus pictus]